MIYLVIRASGRPRDPLLNRRRAQPEAQHGYVLLGPRKVKKQKRLPWREETVLSLHAPKANRYGIWAWVQQWADADTRSHADAADVEMVRVRLRLR